MANEQNLKPSSTRSLKEVRKLGKKGGIASGKVRKEKKTLKGTLDLLLSLNPPTKIKKFRTHILKDGNIIHTDLELTEEMKALFPKIDFKKIDNRAVLAYSLMKQVLKGDTKAIEIIRDTMGEKPVNVFAGDIVKDINIEVRFPK